MKSKNALAAILAILVVSVVANGYLYAAQYTVALDANLQKQANNELQMQIADLQNQIANLTTKTNELLNQNSQLLSQNINLQTQKADADKRIRSLEIENANLKATIADLQLHLPNRTNLVTKLGTTDVLNNNNSHGTFRQRLYIQGEVFNTGDITAYDAQLHVVLYIGDQIIEETYIDLGNIEPLNYVHVSKDIHYEANGQRLTNWIIIPVAKTN